MPVSPPPPASPAEAAIRSAGRASFDLAEAEEREFGPSLGTPYPATGSGNCHTPPPGPVRATLPGRGRRGPGCGARRPVGWIAADGCLPLRIHDCERRECPKCAKPHAAEECPLGIPHGGGDWAHAEALQVAAKLQWYAATQGFGSERPLRQVIVSPPKGRYDHTDGHDRTVERVRRAAAKALRELGWEERYWDSLVIHLWRGCEGKGYDEWGPHAHAVGPGVDVRKVEEYHRRTGVVVKQATEDGTPGSPFVGYWAESLARHLVYELGHAAIVLDGHAVSYLGKGLISFKPPDLEPVEDEGGELEEHDPECTHGVPFVPLGDGRSRYDLEAGEWNYRIDRGRFFRFLDRAPAQGGPLLERVDAKGCATHIVISPYLDQTGLPEPRKRRWVGKPPPGPGGVDPSDAPPWDSPSNWPEVEP